MFAKSKRPAAFVLAIFIVITMLSSLTLPAAFAAETDPYESIGGTLQPDGSYTPAANVVFVNSKFGSGTFKYTYGDGETYGDGRTYTLTIGVNAYRTMLEAIQRVQTDWNKYTGYYAAYTGINTIVAAPGTIGYDQFQNNKVMEFNLPRDAGGATIADPAYEQYFKYTVLGAQAGKNPVTSMTDPTVANGRSLSTDKETLLAGTIWAPANAVLRIEGCAANSNCNLYATKTDTSVIVGMEIDCLYYHVSVADKPLWRFNNSSVNGCLQFTNVYTEYDDMPSCGASSYDTFYGTRLVLDNYYENCTKMMTLSDQYSQAYQKNVWPTNYTYASANLLGNGKKSVLFSIKNSTFNAHPGAHNFRFKFNSANYASYPEKSLVVEIEGNYFLNTGRYPRQSNYNNNTTTNTTMTDTLSFQDVPQCPDDALKVTFKNNKIEYTDFAFEGKDSGGNFFNFSGVKDKAAMVKNFTFKDNIIKSTRKQAMGFANHPAVDGSGILWLDENDNVLPGLQTSAAMHDAYAGDDFSGGIAEQFMPVEGKDMAIAIAKVNAIAGSLSEQAAGIRAEITVIPKAGSTALYNAADVFRFQGDDVEFIGLYNDENLSSEVGQLTVGELDGKYMVAQYKGKTTTARVVYAISIATDDQYSFVDPTESESFYTFNGKTYELTDENCYSSLPAAADAGCQIVVLLPGIHDNTGVDANFHDHAAILGPQFGVSPNNPDMTLNTARGITMSGGTPTFDETKEAICTGMIRIYSAAVSYSTLDGVVCNNVEYYGYGYTFNSERTSRMEFIFARNVFVYNQGKHLISGLGSVSATSIGIMSVKRYIYTDETRTVIPAGKYSALVSAAAQIVESRRAYFYGASTSSSFATHGAAGKYLGISPFKTGISITDCYFDNNGYNGNWIYPNYVDMDTATSWGQTPEGTTEFYPNGFYEIIDNNTFINVPAAGCDAKGYMMRLSYANAPTKIQVTNNTVTNSVETNCRFVDLCYSNAAETWQQDFDLTVENNVFVNFKEPWRFNRGEEPLFSVDENYYAFNDGTGEEPGMITAQTSLSVLKSDWLYLDRGMTVKTSDFSVDASAVLGDIAVAGYPDWTVTGNFHCGVTSFTPADIVGGNDKTAIVGIYADAACANELTGDITALDFYVKTEVADREIVFAFHTARPYAVHDWGDWEMVEGNEPTCTEDGKQTRVCRNCGATEEKNVAALGHTPGSPQMVMPTCTEDAAIVTKCVVCGEIVTSSSVAGSRLGHDWSEWETIEGNCTTDTVTRRTCSRCDEVEEIVETAPGHQFTEWSVKTGDAPTCTVPGRSTRTCTVCGLEEFVVIPALGHDFVRTVTKEATCVDNGLIQYVCSRCGAVDPTRDEVIPATGIHTWGNFVTNAATCNAEGCKARYCTVCELRDETTVEFYPMDETAHVLDEKTWTVVTKGDCLTATVLKNTCSVCGAEITKEDATGVTGAHTFVTTTQLPTFDASGKVENTCSVCGKTELVKVLARLTKFKDVAKGAWYYDAVAYANALGLMTGVGDNMFKPNDPITRAEFTSVIARMAGVSTKKTATTFKDVPKSHWASGAIAWGEKTGIVSGYSSTVFDPDGKITREQICTIIVRFVNYQGITLPKKIAKIKFSDDSKIGGYAKESVYICQRAGIVAGTDGKFNPKNNASRAEICQIIKNYMTAIGA